MFEVTMNVQSLLLRKNVWVLLFLRCTQLLCSGYTKLKAHHTSLEQRFIGFQGYGMILAQNIGQNKGADI